METLYFLLAAAVGVGAYYLINWLYQRKAVKTITEEEFSEGFRKAQLIDVREPNEFDSGHILGARNIPLSQLKMRLPEIRKDKPVYLYCTNAMRSGRAAKTLYRKGFRDLYHLKGGFKKWSGKIKAKKVN